LNLSPAKSFAVPASYTVHHFIAISMFLLYLIVHHQNNRYISAKLASGSYFPGIQTIIFIGFEYLFIAMPYLTAKSLFSVLSLSTGRNHPHIFLKAYNLARQILYT